jgi:hypothetical protein
MGLVARDHLVVPEQAAGDVLDRADGEEDRSLDREHGHDRTQRGTVPADLGEEQVERCERGEEEGDVLKRVGEIFDVRRLQGVEDDNGREHPADRVEPAAPVGRCGPRRSGFAPGVPDGGGEAACDHRVEGKEQVRIAAAEVDRDPERHRRDQRRREPGGPAAEEPGEDRDPDRGGDDRGDEQRRVIAEIGDPGAVPVVGEDQHRPQQDRDGEARDPGAAAERRDQSRSGRDGADDRPGPEQRLVHQPPPPASGSGTVTSIRPGGLTSRPCSPSTTSSA